MSEQLEHLRTDGRDEIFPTPNVGRHGRLTMRTLPYSQGSTWYLIVRDTGTYQGRHRRPSPPGGGFIGPGRRPMVARQSPRVRQPPGDAVICDRCGLWIHGEQLSAVGPTGGRCHIKCPFAVSKESLADQPDVVTLLQKHIERDVLDALLRREQVEVAHLLKYPNAWNYGRHANHTAPFKNVVMHDGGEYVGRHRARFFTELLRTGMAELVMLNSSRWYRTGDGWPPELVGRLL